MPPATKLTTGSLPLAATSLTSLERCLELLGRDEQLVVAHPLEAAHLGEHVPELVDGLDHVAGPRLALGPHHRGAFVDPAKRLAEVPAAAHERDLEGVLVDVIALVGRGEDLGLVDVVDAERLEDLGFDEVADAGLGHDRDAHGVHDPDDHLGVGHAGDSAGRPDVGRDALERHHGNGAGILGDLGLVWGDDIHDDAALEHLGEALLGGPGGRFDGHVGRVPFDGRARFAGRVWPRGPRPFESTEPRALPGLSHARAGGPVRRLWSRWSGARERPPAVSLARRAPGECKGRPRRRPPGSRVSSERARRPRERDRA